MHTYRRKNIIYSSGGNDGGSYGKSDYEASKYRKQAENELLSLLLLTETENYSENKKKNIKKQVVLI